MKSNSWHHKLFHFYLCFWIWKVGKGREKITKISISQEQQELLQLNNKHFFQHFKDYHLGKKEKIDKKIVDTRFNSLFEMLINMIRQKWYTKKSQSFFLKKTPMG